MFSVHVQDNEETINCYKMFDNQCNAIDAEHKMSNLCITDEWFTPKIRFCPVNKSADIVSHTKHHPNAICSSLYEAMQHEAAIDNDVNGQASPSRSNPECVQSAT